MSAPIDLAAIRAHISANHEEASHRIANHLALIVSAIHFRASAIAKGPSLLRREDVQAILQVIIGRLVSLGEVNRTLAHAESARTDAQRCLIETCASLVSALSLEGHVAVAHRLTANCTIDAQQAQALALLVNEIIVNAVKHAHPTGLPVTITVSCDRLADGTIAIEVADDGVGLPENFDTERDGGVGFKVIRSLADCLGAALEIQSDALGLTFRFLLPAAAEGAQEPARASANL